MGNYNLSGKAQYDLVCAYKFGKKHFGPKQAASYLSEMELFLEELAERPELSREASKMATSLKFYNYKAHVIFYLVENENEIFIIRILGKRMNFIEHI